MSKLHIKVKRVGDVPLPTKIAIGDWVDLCAAEDIDFKQFENGLIPLGICMKLPEGYEAHVLPRSSTFKNFGILMTNSMGIIDESYCGNEDQWYFSAVALRDTHIEKGSRICQFRIVKKMKEVKFIEVDDMTDPSRGGYGSTGTK